MNSSHNQFLETAARIGTRICRDAIWSSDRCNWLGDSMEKLDGAWKVAHRALPPDLYNGTAGIALFLHRLHDLTGEPLFRETAAGAIRQACSRAPHLSPSLAPSLYLGVTGIAYVLTAMGLEEEASQTLRTLTAQKELPLNDDLGIDVIGGIAGAIPPLLNMGVALSDSKLLRLAEQYGETLLRLARGSAAGSSWNTLRIPHEQRKEDLTGFSHGTAGIAWALSELFEVTEDRRFSEAAEEARRYERSHFNSRFANWPDFRYLYDPEAPAKTAPAYPMAWCHGAPGIGLDRLRAFEIFGSRILKEEAEIAIRTTETSLVYTEKSNFSLCHGLGGNADLLIQASLVLADPACIAIAEQLAEEGIERFESQDLRWPCGVTDGDETPNLMLGTAGIGYFYLRLYQPRQVPSILILPACARELMLAAS